MELILLKNNVVNRGNIGESHRQWDWSKLKVRLINAYSTLTLPFCQVLSLMNDFRVCGSWEAGHLHPSQFCE